MTRAGACLVLCLAGLALPPAIAAAPGPGADSSEAGLGRLWRLAGTFDYNAILYHPVVSRALYGLLGGREKRRLMDTLQIVHAITTSGNYLILQGHPAAAAGPEAAMVAVGRQGSLDVALLHGAQVTLFTTAPQLAAAAPPILAAAEQWTSRAHAVLAVRHGLRSAD